MCLAGILKSLGKLQTALQRSKKLAPLLLDLTHKFVLFPVRLGSKHNVRASILASSLCLDSASLRGGSIKSHLSCAGSVIAHSVSGRSLSEGRRPLSGGPPSLVIHSSSGVSSGSTSSDTGTDDKNGGPHSPTPSSSSSQGTVKRNPNR